MTRTPKRKTAIATVDAIVETALMLAVQDGAANVTTQRIADVAGIGIGSLYEYFTNKEAVFEELHRRFINQTLEALHPVLPEMVRLPPHEAVSLLAERVSSMLREQPGMLGYLQQPEAFMHMASEFGQHLSPAIGEMGLRYISLNPQFLRQRNLPVLLFIVTNGLSFAVLRYLSMQHTTFSFRELTDGIADILLAMLNTGEPAEAAAGDGGSAQPVV